MHLTNLTQATWDALQKATNDVTSVIQSMATKVRKKKKFFFKENLLFIIDGFLLYSIILDEYQTPSCVFTTLLTL